MSVFPSPIAPKSSTAQPRKEGGREGAGAREKKGEGERVYERGRERREVREGGEGKN